MRSQASSPVSDTVSACSDSIICSNSSVAEDPTLAAAATSAPTTGALPNTGAEDGSLPVGVAGAVLLLGGLVLVGRGRRRLGSHRA